MRKLPKRVYFKCLANNINQKSKLNKKYQI